MIALPEINALLERTGSRGHDAISVGVLEDGNQVFAAWRRGGAPVDERTLFEIGSVTKPVTGVLLADAHLRGDVDLHRPVSDYVPADRLPSWPHRTPTLEELATHRGSLPNVPARLKLRELAFMFGLRRTDPWNGLDEEAFEPSFGSRPAGAPQAAGSVIRASASVCSAMHSPPPRARHTQTFSGLA